MLLQISFTEQAPGAEIHDEDEREPIDNLAQVCRLGGRQAYKPKQLGEQDNEQGAENRTLDIADPSDEEGADNEDALVQGKAVRVDIAHEGGIKDAGHTRYGRGNEERPRLGRRRVAPHGLNRQFIGLDGAELASIRGIMQTDEQEYDGGCQNDRQGQIGVDAGNLPDSEYLDVGNIDPVRTPGNGFPVVQDRVNNELETHRGQDEIISFQLDRSIGNHETEQAGNQGHDGDDGHERQIELRQEERSDISADPVESRLAHGQQVGQANGKIGAEHQHDVDVQHDCDMKEILHLYTALCLKPAIP